MSDSLQSRFRLPHWGWFLLATVVLVVAGIGLAIWLPYHREQQMIQKIESWDGNFGTETVGPVWLRQFVGEDRMQEFAVLDRIIAVYLERSQIPGAEISQLRGLTNLEYLDLSQTAVTDADLAHLNGLTNLDELRLDRTRITDQGLVHLSRLKNLKVLSLNGTQITDSGLVHLSALTNLTKLSIDDTDVTSLGIAEMNNRKLSLLLWNFVPKLLKHPPDPFGINQSRRERTE